MAEMREALGRDLDQVLEVLRQQTLSGDLQAIRILLDRVLPTLRPIELPIALAMPEGNLAQQARAVVQATCAAEIPPAQAAQLVMALGGVARIVETTELVERVEALEKNRDKP